MRKKLNLTQVELAKFSGVSQSLIAKIESGMIDPTFTKVKKIMDTLNTLNHKQELKAKDIYKKGIINIKPNDSLKDTIKKMKKYNISQMPVSEDKNIVGFISEKILLDAVISKDANIKIKDIMEDSPPTITKEANMDVVSNLLKHYPLVIVSENGKVLGIITKSDLLTKAI